MASASAGGGNPGHALAATALARRIGAAAAAAAGAASGDRSSSAFSLTCNRLSQYLKEKGTLGGIGLAFDAAAASAAAVKGTKQEPPRTMNLLPGIESTEPEITAADPAVAPNNNKLPAPPPAEKQLLPAAPAAPQQQPQPPRGGGGGAQMTIFYGGKVIVFDNYPADKAKDLLALAGRGVSGTAPKTQASSVAASAANCGAGAAAHPLKAAPAPAADSLPAATAPAAAPLVPAVVAPAAAAAVVSQDRPQKPPQVPISSDLPIARRVSLNRFLEKRKDRIQSKAPYPVNAAASPSSDGKPLLEKDKQQQQPAMPLPLKEKEKQQLQQPWLGLAPSESL